MEFAELSSQFAQEKVHCGELTYKVDELTRKLAIKDAETLSLKEIQQQRDELMNELESMKSQAKLFNQAVASLHAELAQRFQAKEAEDVKHKNELQQAYNRINKYEDQLAHLQDEYT